MIKLAERKAHNHVYVVGKKPINSAWLELESEHGKLWTPEKWNRYAFVLCNYKLYMFIFCIILNNACIYAILRDKELF